MRQTQLEWAGGAERCAESDACFSWMRKMAFHFQRLGVILWQCVSATPEAAVWTQSEGCAGERVQFSCIFQLANNTAVVETAGSNRGKKSAVAKMIQRDRKRAINFNQKRHCPEIWGPTKHTGITGTKAHWLADPAGKEERGNTWAWYTGKVNKTQVTLIQMGRAIGAERKKQRQEVWRDTRQNHKRNLEKNKIKWRVTNLKKKTNWDSIGTETLTQRWTLKINREAKPWLKNKKGKTKLKTRQIFMSR